MSWSFDAVGDPEAVKEMVLAHKVYGDPPEWAACRDAVVATCDRMLAGPPNPSWKLGLVVKAFGHVDPGGSYGNNVELSVRVVPSGIRPPETTPHP